MTISKIINAGIGSVSGFTIEVSNTTAYNASATDGQLDVGTTLFLKQSGLNNNAVSQIVFQPRDSQGFNRIVNTGGSSPKMTFVTDDAERMRIDNSGNVLVDKTDTSVSTNGIMLKVNGQYFSTTAGANTYHYYDSSNSRYNFYVLGNGGIANYSSNNVALSDQTEKKNIVTASSAWDDVKALSVKEFHYNFEDDADPKRLGVIAQDIQVNHPNLITSFNIDDDTTKLGVVEQQLTWMAIKALQEAMAKIETLETKVAALEAG